MPLPWLNPSVLAAVVLLSATLSSGDPAAPTSPTPVPTVTKRLLPKGADLTGQWTVGPGKEPVARVQRIEEPCYGGAQVWELAQDGDRVSGDMTFPHRVGGAMLRWEPQASEHVEGAFDGTTLHLEGHFQTGYSYQPSPFAGGPGPCGPDGPTEGRPCAKPPSPGTDEPVVYEMRWSSKTGHLVGTRNGTPYWAARMVLVPRKTSCGPPPP